MRGSDPQAVLHYLARMLHAGEDINFIARRIIIAAAEDVGLANPRALEVAVAAAKAVRMIGMPEARIILSEAALMVALSPKSNSAYLGIDRALEDVKKGRIGEVPLHLRDSGYPDATKFGHGEGIFIPMTIRTLRKAAYLPKDWKGQCTMYLLTRERKKRRMGNGWATAVSGLVFFIGAELSNILLSVQVGGDNRVGFFGGKAFRAGLSFLGEFTDRKVEKEYAYYEVKYSIKFVRPTVLLLGSLYFLFIIADFSLIGNGRVFNAILINRVLFLMISIYSFGSRNLQPGSYYVSVTAYEITGRTVIGFIQVRNAGIPAPIAAHFTVCLLFIYCQTAGCIRLW